MRSMLSERTTLSNKPEDWLEKSWLPSGANERSVHRWFSTPPYILDFPKTLIHPFLKGQDSSKQWSLMVLQP